MDVCTGSVTDKWRTVWRCELEAHDFGLCRSGVMQWTTPGIGDRPTHVLRDLPVDFYQWREGAEDVPGWLPVEALDTLFGALRIRTGEHSYVHLFPNEWAVRWSSGRLFTLNADQFTQLFEARDA